MRLWGRVWRGLVCWAALGLASRSSLASHLPDASDIQTWLGQQNVEDVSRELLAIARREASFHPLEIVHAIPRESSMTAGEWTDLRERLEQEDNMLVVTPDYATPRSQHQLTEDDYRRVVHRFRSQTFDLPMSAADAAVRSVRRAPKAVARVNVIEVPQASRRQTNVPLERGIPIFNVYRPGVPSPMHTDHELAHCEVWRTILACDLRNPRQVFHALGKYLHEELGHHVLTRGDTYPSRWDNVDALQQQLYIDWYRDRVTDLAETILTDRVYLYQPRVVRKKVAALGIDFPAKKLQSVREIGEAIGFAVQPTFVWRRIGVPNTAVLGEERRARLKPTRRRR